MKLILFKFELGMIGSDLGRSDASSRKSDALEDFFGPPVPFPESEKSAKERAHAIFQRQFGPHVNFCIATTGSDARNENFYRGGSRVSVSPLELIIVEGLQSHAPIHAIEEITEGAPDFFDPKIEVQNLNKNRTLTYTSREGVSTFFPCRAIDAVPIYGNPEAMLQYKRQAFQSLKMLKPKEFKHWEKSFFLKELKNLKACQSLEDTRSVNLETGELRYDNHTVKSTKHCLLRAVQYWTAVYLIHAVKQGVIDQDAFLNFPVTIEDRLMWFLERGYCTIPSSDIQNLIQAYKQALSYYCQSQEAFLSGQEAIQVDPIQLRETVRVLDEFTSKPPESFLPIT